MIRDPEYEASDVCPGLGSNIRHPLSVFPSLHRVLRDQFASDLKSASGDPSWVTGITVRKYFAPVGRDMQASIDALRAMARAPEPVLLGENLHRIQCPVLLLTGGAEHSGSLPPQGLVRLGEGLRHFTHREVPGAGARRGRAEWGR